MSDPNPVPARLGSNFAALREHISGWVNVRSFGAKGDGVTDDTAAFQAALNAGSGRYVLVPYGLTLKIAGTLTVSASTTIWAHGATIRQTTNSVPLLKATAVDNITILGGVWEGVGSGVAFSNGDEGLLYFLPSGSTTVDNLKIEGVEVKAAYTGISALRVQNLIVAGNYIHDFTLYGILASRSAHFTISDNIVRDCAQAGGATAYGIHATGDEAGGVITRRAVISGNIIDGVPSWDGIMTHDASHLVIANNVVTNVRSGIDVGHGTAANVIKDIVVAGNIVVATTTDTWAGAGAAHFGIGVLGYDGTARVSGAVIVGNRVRGWNQMSGSVISGSPGSIVAGNADDVTVVGNSVSDVGTATAARVGIRLEGTLNRVVVQGNSLQGSMISGAIRGVSVTGDYLAINGNAIAQTTSTHEGILFTGSTLTRLAYGGNPTNSTVPFSLSTSTATTTLDTPNVGADQGDTSPVLTAADAHTQLFSSALTGNRTVTLPSSGVGRGDTFRIVRTGLGAFTLDVGGLKTIPSATAAFVDVAYNGSAWVLTGYGTL